MPIQSKYSNQTVENLMVEIQTIMDKNHAATDLQLMVLGNLVSQLLSEKINQSQREILAQKFSQALLQSIK